MVLPGLTLPGHQRAPKTPTIELFCTGSCSESTIESPAHSRQASLCVHDHGDAAIAIQHGCIA